MVERRADWLAQGSLVVLWTLAVLWVGVAGDFPLNDDWAYGYSARLLAQRGELRILDWAAPSLVAHIAWGALCLRLLGDSFVSLRLGTLFLSLLGALLLYRLGRRLGLPARLALLPPLALLFSPWNVNLSFTYMTDVPWLTLMLGMLLCAQTALSLPDGRRRARIGYLLAASLLLGTASLIRQFAVAVLPALAFCLLQARQLQRLRPRPPGTPSPRSSAELAAILLPVVVIYGAFHLWYTRVHGATLANRETWERILELRGYQQLFHLGASAYYCGFFLLPLAVGIGLRRLRGWADRRLGLGTALFLAGFALVLAFLGAIDWLSSTPRAMMRPTMPYLCNLFSLLGLGPPTLNPDAYAGQEPLPHGQYGWLGPLLTVASLSSLAALSRALWPPLLQVGRAGLALLARSREPAASLFPGGASEAQIAQLGRRSLLWGVLLCYLGWHVLTGPFVFDRYLLPLLPLIWLLVLCELPTSLPRLGPTVAMITLVAVPSLALTREYLSWNAARKQAVDDLQAAGTPTSDIDGGFELNGTWRFLETVRRTGHLNDAHYRWWTTSRRYALSFAPARPPCQTVRSYPFWSWPPAPSASPPPAVYVMQCPPDFQWPTAVSDWARAEESLRQAGKR